MAREYSGQTDPARTLQVLWGTRAAGARGPRPGLTVAEVADAAIAVADSEGLAALSMRRVADRLGRTPMSLYRYVQNKAEMLDVMVDRVARELPALDAAAGWRAKLELSAREHWALYHRHPWVLQISTHRPTLGPHGMASYEELLAALRPTGMPLSQVVSVVELLYAYVRGCARTSVDAQEAAVRTDVSDEEWWSARAPILAQVVTESSMPNLRRMQPEDRLPPPDQFEFGLARALDGVAMFADAPRTHQR